ncbi:D-alanyl-D-alanine carboxypeptidase [Simkania negevensis]|uniref:D-alanyl-D-alanine carboxypeptidase n=1 Tax=Simkania negevensis TaxID=83561 RepID=A0ABS3ARW6_9BACT|nr:D-alanyl-D-alanine carboxypeptidase [Simkania negevensis]
MNHLRFLFFLSFFSLFLTALSSLDSEPLHIDIASEAGLLMNAKTGVILYEKNGEKQMAPGSTTKIATALYTLTHAADHLYTLVTAEQEAVASISPELKIRSNYKAPSYWNETDGTHIGIKRGEVFSLHNLLNGLLINSGNDAANCIAQYFGKGDIPAFVDELNRYLKDDLGLEKTYFTNPHGLHHPNHMTTAKELALITKEALKIPAFRTYVMTKRWERPKTNKQETSMLYHNNKLIKPGQYYYPHAIGVKTGYHSKAGHTFVGAAEKDGRTLICVVFKAQRNETYQDCIKLFDAAFEQPKLAKRLLSKGEQPYTLQLKEANAPLKTFLREDLLIEYYPAEEADFQATLFWDPLTLPIEAGQKVGSIKLSTAYVNAIQELPLYAQNRVDLSLLARIKKLTRNLSKKPGILLGGLVSVGLLLLIVGRFRKKRK